MYLLIDCSHFRIVYIFLFYYYCNTERAVAFICSYQLFGLSLCFLACCSVGRDGLTHNMLNDIHNHWKHAEAVRIKCLGVPTVDMKNVCTQLEVAGFFLI